MTWNNESESEYESVFRISTWINFHLKGKLVSETQLNFYNLSKYTNRSMRSNEILKQFCLKNLGVLRNAYRKFVIDKGSSGFWENSFIVVYGISYNLYYSMISASNVAKEYCWIKRSLNTSVREI